MKWITLTTVIAALLCLAYSCTQPPHDTEAKRRADSLALQAKAAELAKQMLQHHEDSIAQAKAASLRRIYGPCPVAIKTCLLVGQSNGAKAIVVTVKNVSSRKIDAVKLAWTVYNGKGERIGRSSGMAKKQLQKGLTGSYSWAVNAKTGIRAKASVAVIHYHDGSFWMAD
jgi:hypothetical protein